MTVTVLTAGGAAARGDVEKGKALYETCEVCHKIQPMSTEHGPSLIGILGRRPGALDDFRYSRALQRANIVWNETTLDAYLADPQTFLVGSRMPFPGISDDSERANLIAFLKTLR
jgi:cytochrome c